MFKPIQKEQETMMVINPIVGVYIPMIRIPFKGGMTIPNIATFDHGTIGTIDHGTTSMTNSPLDIG